MDKLQFHYDRSIFSEFKNQQFWNPEISWKNKWEPYKPKTSIGKFFNKFLFKPSNYIFVKSVKIINFLLKTLNLPWRLYKNYNNLTLRATLFVFTTDAWHLFQSIFLNSLFLSIYFLTITEFNLINFISVIIGRVIFGLIFTYTFHKKLENK